MRRNICKKIDVFLTIAIITILLPLFVATIGQRMRLEELIYGQGNTGDGGVGTETPAGEEDIKEQEEQLIGIVAKEIGADAEMEAIMAQCVIARTTLYDSMRTQTAVPQGMGVEEMQTLWGEQFEACFDRIEKCVTQTAGEVLLWEEDYAYAPYHSISAGSTRNMSELYSDVQMPYLKAQICEKDAVVDGYLAVSYWECEEFIEECNRLFPESKVSTYEDVAVEKRDEAGYVLRIKVGATSCEGETFREAFALNSAHFSVSLVDDKVRIVTKGLGHGFGLSQNTANEMAKDGADYREILGFFFPGTIVEKLSDEK